MCESGAKDPARIRKAGGDANCNLGYGRFRHGYQQVTCDQERTGAICGLGSSYQQADPAGVGHHDGADAQQREPPILRSLRNAHSHLTGSPRPAIVRPDTLCVPHSQGVVTWGEWSAAATMK